MSAPSTPSSPPQLSSFDPGAPALYEGLYGLPFSAEEARVVILPVPWEPTTSYRKGTAKGPAAILEASKQVDLFDLDTGRPYEHGIALLPVDPRIEAWNAEACAAAEPVIACGGALEGDPALERSLARVNELSARLDALVLEATRAQLEAGKLVGLLGGDHSTPFGCIAAHLERYPDLGVLHFDAHADLREAYEGFEGSHASIMHNVLTRLPLKKLVQVGIRDFSEEEHERAQRSGGRVVVFHDARIASRLLEGEAFVSIAREIVAALPQEVYVSFDIDGLDPTLCPHTGTPVPGGLSFPQAVCILRELRRSGRRLVGFDLNEVAPGPDDEWDANVGARLLYKLIGFALAS